jgi:hypothetical protein
MSIESVAIALHHSRSSQATKLVLLGIANHDGDGGAWPSVETLAKYANCSTRNVQKAIAKLIELGEIAEPEYVTLPDGSRHRIHERGGLATTPEHLRPNLYHFILRCPEWCDRSSQHRDIRR